MSTEWLNSLLGEFLSFDNDVWQRLLSLLEYDPMSPLTLTTGFFLFASFIFGIGYFIVRNRAHLRTIYVVLFSLYFYYKLSGIYLLLLLFVAISDFLIGRGVYRRKVKELSTRPLVVLSVVINVAILVYFKATNFFVDTINNLYGSGVLDWESVVVPAGVSFFVARAPPAISFASKRSLPDPETFMSAVTALHPSGAPVQACRQDSSVSASVTEKLRLVSANTRPTAFTG